MSIRSLMQTVQTWKSFRDLKWVQGSGKTLPHRGYSFLGTSATTSETSVKTSRWKWKRYFFFKLCEPYSNRLMTCQKKVTFALTDFPGTAPKFKTSHVYCLFDVLLHLTVDTVIDIIILISLWLIDEDSHCCLLCLADSDTTRVAHVFLFFSL